MKGKGRPRKIRNREERLREADPKGNRAQRRAAKRKRKADQ